MNQPNTTADTLQRIKIVLVQPLYGGNIGSSVRALATMGLRKLCLVAPKNFPSKEATILSANAKDLLAEIQVCETLDQALAECTLVVGTSARNRWLSPEVCELRTGITQVISHATQHRQANIAILFGSEDKGLENSELDKCRLHLFIDTDADYSSLNLAAAVQLICYELRRAALMRASKSEQQKQETPLANQAGMEHFYAHLEEWLQCIRFFNPQRPATIMRKMRRIFGRADLQANEVEMLRGMLSNSIRSIKKSSATDKQIKTPHKTDTCRPVQNNREGYMNDMHEHEHEKARNL